MVNQMVGQFIMVGDQILATEGLLGVSKNDKLLGESGIVFKYRNGLSGDDYQVVKFDSSEQMEKEFQYVTRQLVK